jgi:hypothetical protein
MPWGEVLSDTGWLRVADAEQEKSTGGMIALYPRADDAYKLAVPGGEPPEELHVTLAFLGDDVSGIDPTDLLNQLPQVLDNVTVITARIMGHALFNPDGGDDPEDPKEPCAVYLVGDSEQLPELHSDIMDLIRGYPSVPEQHVPWIPHVTGGYSLPIDALSYTGPVLFDRVGLAFAGNTKFFPLMGSTL